MPDPLGFIVVEYPPGAAWPDCNPHGEIHREISGARHERHNLEMTARSTGHRETYRIAEVRLVEDDTDDR
ncbi:hypothetical protein FHS43_006204 [Streptosporangium becharense]|uniref:Uncharacterized protein n=1 Tax=Streptosporangium becharense TaxID=1816182 RepID=A0A7W9IGJ1_9ACTN|nr:hypothetical protein [Streptosporangium becharense]MBB2914892.1 hypothetical protein [Streptosporangium becharense]MBB5820297.1 hypothetical protein [Streptosporangium becharense]